MIRVFDAFSGIGGFRSAFERVGGYVVDEWTSDGTNHVVTALSVGKYVLKETAAPDGYRKHGQIEWAPAAIIFGCLLFSLTAPLYIWTIVGM